MQFLNVVQSDSFLFVSFLLFFFCTSHSVLQWCVMRNVNVRSILYIVFPKKIKNTKWNWRVETKSLSSRFLPATIFILCILCNNIGCIAYCIYRFFKKKKTFTFQQYFGGRCIPLCSNEFHITFQCTNWNVIISIEKKTWYSFWSCVDNNILISLFWLNEFQ